ncbi:MAG: SPOR domain-containing protein [Candidatus Thiodiazotropha sp.]
MADYKHRAGGGKSRAKSSCSCGFHLFAGLVAGAFLMGLAWLQLGPNLSDGDVPGIKARPQPKAAQETSPPAPKPTFEFYTILPEMEVVIPDEEIVTPEEPPAAHKPQPRETTTASIPEQGSYILQMGSFRKYQDADRLKARLALIGIEAEIQKVSINNRDTYHRVRSGPYASQSQLNAARKLARENGITSLVIKLKN